ncbi:preprotein translocase subunit SecG [Sphingomonas sp. ASV193]|uniref:preprotein translocase subunit SecG n=1 Tax=Sphingomonas sp. ASV193 TaxID=3144405 RepID=UPI0032E91887
MFTFLLIVQTIVAALLVWVILMQRSEGGGLGVASSSGGFMTARGAADFLTRATAILGGLFIALCILLAAIAGARETPKFDSSLVKPQTGQKLPATPAPGTPAPTTPSPAVPLQ